MKVLNARAIRVWLAQQDLTQADLAARAGLAAETLSRAMTGKAPASAGIVLGLHEATGIPVPDLTIVALEEMAS